MTIPAPRNAGVAAQAGVKAGGCDNASCMFFSQGCTIGCNCTEDNSNTNFSKHMCDSPQRPTLNAPKWRTYNVHINSDAPPTGGCKGTPISSVTMNASATCATV